MADRQLRVTIVGDSSQLDRTFKRASRSAKGFGSDVERAGRGALAATVSFHGLGRALAFSSAQFLGGAGIVYGLKSTIQAAEESQRVLGQTRNAVKRSGESWAVYGKQIQKAALQQANLSGFDDERLLGTFSQLVRRTGDVNQALKLNALAANVARGRNISLEQAAQLVLKASIGLASALRRLGIDAKKGASSVQLLGLLQQRYAGSAEAYGRTAAGAQDRFRVALQNTQETIGTALLPTITRYLNRASDWLSSSRNQAQIQQTVNTVVQGSANVARDLADAVRTVTPAVKGVVDVLGGLKNVAELALGVALVRKAKAAASAFGLIRAASAVTRTGIVADAAAEVAALGGVAAAGARTFPGGIVANGPAGQIPNKDLRTAGRRTPPLAFLTGNPVLTGVTAGLALAYLQNRIAPDKNGRVKLGGSNNVTFDPKTGQFYAGTKGIEGKITEARAAQYLGTTVKQLDKRVGLQPLPASAFSATAGLTRGLRPQPFTKPGQSFQPSPAPLGRGEQIALNVQQARVDVARGGGKQAEDRLVAALREQAAFDRKYEAVQARLIKTGTGDRKKHAQILQRLQADEESALSEVTSILTGRAADAKKNATAAKKAAAAKIKIPAHVTGKVPLAEGYETPIGLQIEAAKASLTAIKDDDVKAAKRIKAAARKALASGRLSQQAQLDALNAIIGVNDQLSGQGRAASSSYHRVSAEALTAGLGLSKAARVEAEARIAQAMAHGGRAPNGPAALGIPVGGQQITVNVHGTHDPERVANKVIEKLERKAKGVGGQRRGRHGGSKLGVH